MSEKIWAAVRRGASNLVLGVGVAISGGLQSAVAEDLRVPIPCNPGICSGNNFLGTAGSTTPIPGPGLDDLTGRQVDLLIDQKLKREVFNWESFNVGADAEVYFRQRVLDAAGNPTAVKDPTMAAINVVNSTVNPSEILGVLRADGQVYLINPNGVLFGQSARVDTNTLVVSGLSFADGVDPAIDDLFQFARDPAVGALFANDGQAGDINIEEGAQLIVRENGRIVLVGANVTNAGRLEASGPGGQVLLVAGEDDVYLFTDEPLGNTVEDSATRGLDVAVGTGGTATNTGIIKVGPGNVTMAGGIVNQSGVVRATTAINNNGSIRLLAKTGAQPAANEGSEPDDSGASFGQVTLGANSVTEISLGDNASELAFDSQSFSGGQVYVNGQQIAVERNAVVSATSGEIVFEAQAVADQTELTSDVDNDAIFVRVEEGARIDASGVDRVSLPVSANFLELELRGNELADSPVQRGGALQGSIVTFDARRPLPGIANFSAAIGNRQRTLEERSLVGGSIEISAVRGEVSIADSATLDVSGGYIEYQEGRVSTSLLSYQGRIYDIHDAPADLPYDAVLSNPIEIEYERWGVTETFYAAGGLFSAGVLEQGYVEGKDAGSIVIDAANILNSGRMVGTAVQGVYQRNINPFDAITVNPLTGALRRTLLETGVTEDIDLNEFASVSRRRQSSLGDLTGFLRPYDELAASGRLVMRSSVYEGDASLAGTASGDLRLNWSSGGDSARATVTGFGEIELAGSSFTIPETAVVDLGAGGALRVLASSAIQIDGDITSPGGDVILLGNPDVPAIQLPASFPPQFQSATGRVGIGSNADINLAGRFVLDSSTTIGLPTPNPIAIDGGNLLIENVAAGETPDSGLFVDAGARVNVGGGAYAPSGGGLLAGNGGVVSLSNQTFLDETRGPDFSLLDSAVTQINGTFSGFTFGGVGVDAPVRNSAFRVQAPKIYVAGDYAPADAPVAGDLVIGQSYLEDAGFHHVVLDSTDEVLGLPSGVDLSIRPDRLQAQLSFGLVAGDFSVAPDTVSVVGPVDTVFSAPSSLTLLSTQTKFADAEETDPLTAPNKALVIDAGSRLAVNAGGDIVIRNEGSLILAGDLSARAGSVTLEAALPYDNEPGDDAFGLNSRSYGFQQDLMLKLADGSSIDVSGVVAEQQVAGGGFVAVATDLARLILDAGDVNLVSGGGFLVADTGAGIDISSGRGTVNAYTEGAPLGLFGYRSAGSDAVAVATDAGSLNLETGTGGAFFASVDGRGDSALGAAGGTLSVLMDGGLRPDTAKLGTTVFYDYFVLPNADDSYLTAEGDPVEEYRIVVSDAQTDPLASAPAVGADLTGLFNELRVGLGNFIAGGGDDIRLTARTNPVAASEPILTSLQSGSSITAPASRILGEANISFVGDFTLDVPGMLTLDAPVLQSDGGSATLNAGFARVGSTEDGFLSTDRTFLTTVDPEFKTFLPVSGTGSLTVNANDAELIGFTSLHGFGADSRFSLVSSGDLRLTGVRTRQNTSIEQPGNQGNSRRQDVQLVSVGDIVLAGDRVYTSTLANFTADVDRVGGAFAFVAPEVAGSLNDGALSGVNADIIARGRSAPSASVAPRTVAGSMAVTADNIYQATSLYAPLGAITLEATDALVLTQGSLTSVSANGLSLPFGKTELGDFVVPYLDPSVTSGEGDPYRTTVVIKASPDADNIYEISVPEKSVDLAVTSGAGELRFDSGARVDVRGGGEIFATEFTSGPTGTVDLLDPTANPSAFAILPADELPLALIDPIDSPNFTYGTVSFVNLEDTGVAGLPAGRYAILPARYALADGAFLVTPDGGPVVVAAGAATPYVGADGIAVAYGSIGDYSDPASTSLKQAFRIETRTQLLDRAEYLQTSMDTFFLAQAEDVGAVALATPRDAGRLVLDSAGTIGLGGQLVAGRPEGRGSLVDIIAGDISIGVAVQPGVLTLAPDLLADLGADSILLGGRRTVVGDETFIQSVSAGTISVQDAVDLTLSGLLLAAQDEISVASTARITATGAGGAGGTLVVDDDAALVGVSNRVFTSTRRTVVGDSVARIEGDLAASGSIIVDAGDAFDIASADLTLADGAALLLGADAIVLGAGAPGDSALDGALVDVGDGTLSTLGLRATTEISLAQAPQTPTAVLRLDAPGLVAAAGLADLSISVDTLELGNASGNAFAGAVGSGANLTISANQVVLGSTVSAGDDDAFTLGGFDGVSLATPAVFASGDHTLRFDLSGLGSQLVDIRTDRISAAAGRGLAVEASGDLAVRRLATGTDADSSLFDLSEAARLAGAGARVSLVADAIDFSSVVTASGGSVGLRATTGDLRLADGAFIDVAGLSNLTFGTQVLGTPGGSVELQADSGNLVVGGGTPVAGLGTTRVLVDVSAGAGAASTASAGELVLYAGNGDLTISSPGRVALRGSSVDGGLGANFTARFGGLAGVTIGDLLTVSGQTGTGSNFNGTYAIEAVGGTGSSLASLALAAGENINARRIRLVNESGNVSVNSRLDASGERAGEILIAGRDGVLLGSSAVLDTSASGGLARTRQTLAVDGQYDAGYSGGRVELAADAGDVSALAGATIDVAGTRADVDTGLLSADASGLVRLVEANQGGAVDVSDMNATLIGTGVIEILSYQEADFANLSAAVTAAQQPVNATTSATIDAANAEVVAATDLKLTSLGDIVVSGGSLSTLSQLFANTNEAGRVTVAAAGDLTLSGNLVDGRDATTLKSDTERSWSMGLVAGADVGSVQRDAVKVDVPQTLLIDGEVATGTGDISLAASGDINFGSTALVASTGRHIDDVATADHEFYGTFGTVEGVRDLSQRVTGMSLPEQGGTVRVAAGGDVTFPDNPAALGVLGYRDYLAVTGSDSDTVYFPDPRQNSMADMPRSWGFLFDNLLPGTVGSFGGGLVEFAVGGDVTGGSYVVSAAGRQVGEIGALVSDRTGKVGPTNIVTDVVETLSPGELMVRAGDFNNADLTIAYGEAHLALRGDAVGTTGTVATPRTANPTRIFLGQAELNLQAAGSLEIGAVIDPTTVRAGAAMDAFLTNATLDTSVSPVLSEFFTSGETTRLALSATSGDLTLKSYQDGFAEVDFSNRDSRIVADIDYFLPTRFSAVAFTGDVLFEEETLGLFPSRQSEFLVGAGGDVRFASAGLGLAGIKQYEAVFDDLITSRFQTRIPFEPTQVQGRGGTITVFGRTETGPKQPVADLGLALVQPPSVPNHTGDLSPNEIVAIDGDISRLRLGLNEAVTLSAGRDVVNVEMVASNVNATDVSSVSAGRDIRQPAVRNPLRNAGAISLGNNDAGFLINGGGDLVVAAGRDIDLGTSLGIRSLGSREDTRLEDLDGARLAVLSGVAEPSQHADFLTAFTDEAAMREAIAATLSSGSVNSDAALAELVSNGMALFSQDVAQRLDSYLATLETAGLIAPSSEDAITRFVALPEPRKLAFSVDVLFDIIEASGRDGTLVYANTATAQLFPTGLTSTGDIRMPLSTVQTQDGGDINLLAPYGSANTGLTALAGLPDDFRADKELGVIAFQSGDAQAYVAQDYEVNSTRLFAQSGGNVLAFARDGNIDAGRGAKSVSDIEQPVPEYDRFGNFSDRQPLAVSGSGIRSFAPPGVDPGDVLLFAPQGTINAGDAGIGSAGGLVAVANQIIGGDNIAAAGPTSITTSTSAVSVDVGSADVGAAATRAATQAAEQAAQRAAESEATQAAERQAPQLAKIDVDVLSFGE